MSDRDSMFTLAFWERLMELCGVQLNILCSRHLQADGASQIMNGMVGNFLQCCFAYHRDDSNELLPAFLDKDGTVTDTWPAYIHNLDILPILDGYCVN